MQLILTVDTEADNQWNVRAPLTTANLLRVPRLQQLCDEFGFAPTYLCTYEVATSDSFAETLTQHAADGRAEIGAHLHPWSTPPFDNDWDGVGLARPYPSELPVGLLARKLTVLTDVIARGCGARPTSYRAGRWGFSTAQIPLLVELGYLIDCSVTPSVSWQRDTGLHVGGPDFTEAPATPYVLAEDDPCQAGASGLLEVPVTIVHTNSVMHRVAAARRWYRRHRRSLPARAANRWWRVAPQWFRPFPDMSAQHLIAVFETARRRGLPVVEMMFHSSELLPGGSPYNPTEADVDRLFARLMAVFRHLAARGVKGATLSQFARARVPAGS